MTQQEKQLLLKDLCARLPYGVKINLKSDYTREMGDTELTPYHLDGLGYNAEYRNLRPYLRPMSSMTEEEAIELLFIRLRTIYGKDSPCIKGFIKVNEVSFRKEPPYTNSIAVWFSFKNGIKDNTSKFREYSKVEYLGLLNNITLKELDWLNAHHFDYRIDPSTGKTLIESGLALKAPEGMYKED